MFGLAISEGQIATSQVLVDDDDWRILSWVFGVLELYVCPSFGGESVDFRILIREVA